MLHRAPEGNLFAYIWRNTIHTLQHTIAMSKIAVGVDIGGTNTVFGLVNQQGEVLVKGSIPTPSDPDVDKYIASLAGEIKALIESVKKLGDNIEILGIGIGAPNANYYKGTIEQAPNLAFKGVVPFVEKLKAHFECGVVAMTNDANAAAIGEMVYGGAKEMRNFAMITLGTGLGSGIIVNGELVYGHDGFAGECGHTTIVPEGRVCGCGGRGHLEAYCSAPGIKRTALELMARYNDANCLLNKYTLDELDARKIHEAAVQGDAIARETFELTGYYLGLGLANTVAHLSPEAIFLFGGPTAAGDYIFKPTIESLNRHVPPIFRDKVQVLPSELREGSAAIVGASALVWQEIAKQA